MIYRVTYYSTIQMERATAEQFSERSQGHDVLYPFKDGLDKETISVGIL